VCDQFVDYPLELLTGIILAHTHKKEYLREEYARRGKIIRETGIRSE
jgi:hypothetical protein